MLPTSSPRWFFREPSDDAVQAFLSTQASAVVSYPEVGLSRENGIAPPGYTLDHNRVKLGQGELAFERACAALRAWRMFPAPWTKISPANAPLRAGQVVAMQAKGAGLWWLNACRIVYVLDEVAGPVRRFGFAYGTLPAHVEQGEERFSVELHADGAVWYDLRAFSRPRYWPVRLANPVARRLQRRFVQDSQQAMRQAAETKNT